MRIPFWCLTILLVYNSLYFVSACDKDACNIGTSGALEVGCGVATALTGIGTTAACTVGAVFTFGLTCAGALVTTGLVAGGCAAGKSASSSGKILLKNLKDYRGSSLSTNFGIWKKSYYAKFVLVSTT